MTDLSIIIVSYRGWKSLTKCLDSLNSFTGQDFSTEVIVVDNRSDDEIINEIEEQFTKFIFIHNKINGGFANGCNLGARNASGKFLLFLNPDTVASESEVKRLLDIAKGNSDYTILSCRQVNELGKESIATGLFPEFHNLTGFQRAIFKNRRSGSVVEKANTGNELFFPDWISGSVVMMKKDIYGQLNGFDEDFWMYYEDVDICKRAQDAGGRIVFCKNITIEHNHGGSSRMNLRITSLTKTEVYISRHVYISKHKRGVERGLIQAFLVVNSLISSGLTALLGTVLFFIPGLLARTLIFIRLIRYYTGSIIRLSWISPRAVNFHK